MSDSAVLVLVVALEQLGVEQHEGSQPDRQIGLLKSHWGQLEGSLGNYWRQYSIAVLALLFEVD